MKRYKGKTARWQQQDKEEQRMNKTEFIKVRCTLEEKQRIKSKAESTGRKFSDYCRETLLNGEVIAQSVKVGSLSHTQAILPLCVLLLLLPPFTRTLQLSNIQ